MDEALRATPAGVLEQPRGARRVDAEQLVCADALLSLLDRQLAQAVSEAERKVTDPTALLRDQDDWRARVRDACRTLDCLEHVYTQRTAGLRAIGGFAEVR